ncbi:MAG: sugar transferase [bacterium]
MTLAVEFQELIRQAGNTQDIEMRLARRPRDVPNGLTGGAKRAIDLLIAVSVFIFVLPLLAALALLIKSQDDGPVLFKQTRCGLNGKKFTVFKFRTMTMNAEQKLEDLLATDAAAAAEWAQTQKLKNDPRITPLGRFLRKSSLDELPQLFNILRGDMSVIGPRPVTFGEIPRYGHRLAYYLSARPGITGLWQVNGRNRLSYEQRMDYDVDYVKNWSFATDIYILLKTVPAVIFAKGAF